MLAAAWQLEVEVQAELLAQSKPKRPVDPGAQRSVDDQLHAAGFVEEPLEHDVVVCRHHAAEPRTSGPQIVDDQGCGNFVHTRHLLH